MEKLENICLLETFAEHEEAIKLIGQCVSLKSGSQHEIDSSKIELIYERFVKILDRYQDQPQLIDSHLKEMLSQLMEPIYGKEKGGSAMAYHTACKLIYHISKVRGYKTILRHLPHEVSDLEIALSLLSQEPADNLENWQTRYVLWMWLSLLFTLPFDFRKFDSTTGDQIPLMERIMKLIRKYLVVGDSPRLAAAVACGRFITRPEISKFYLKELIDWFMTVIDEVFADQVRLQTRAGVLLAVAYVFKHGKREDVSIYGANILEKIVNRDISRQSKDYLVKILMKIVQRVGLSLLPVKVASWRYSKGRRSIGESLQKASQPYSSNASEHSLTEEHDIDDNFQVPSEIEDVLSFLLDGLRYNSNTARWSAAKGIGRVTSRLPHSIAGEVVSSVCEILGPKESDSAWHGGCLALAELARRGLILPSQLNQVIPRVIKALTFEESKGNFAVGDHVRDSACYVVWAFARAYNAADLCPFIDDITSALLTAAVFDREIKCRRAASAAYQEIVGRLENIPNGIEIITTVDNVAVGRTRRAFLELSKFVAQYHSYLHPLIIHLIERKVNHWDCEIRELSGEALSNLAGLAPEKTIRDYILPELLKQSESGDLDAKHGSIIALSLVTYALKLRDFEIPPNIVERMKLILHNSKSWLVFKGVKGDLLRSALCILIEKIALSNLPLGPDSEELLGVLLEVLRDCTSYPDLKIRRRAVIASKTFFQSYLIENVQAKEKWIQDLLVSIKSDREVVRCGSLEALANLPECMMESKTLSKILFDIISSLNNTNDEESLWVEWKVAAINCLTKIILTFDEKLISLNLHMIKQTFRYNLNKAIEDYTTSSKGDIGEAVRIAAINSLKDLGTHLIRFSKNVPSEDMIITEDKMQRILSQILVNCVSHHLRMRDAAGATFFKLLYCFQDYFDLKRITEALPSLEEAESIHWKDDTTYSIWVGLFPLTEYCYPLWKGLVLSIGGVPNKTVENSSKATISKLHSIKKADPSTFDTILDEFIHVYNDYLKMERMCLPLMNTLHKLIQSGVINDISNEKLDNLLEITWKLVSTSPSPKKKMTSINIFCESLRFKGRHKKCLSILAIFLCTRYPVVRVYTADALYRALTTYGDIVFEGDDEDGTRQEEALSILADCDYWNKDIPTIRPTRDKLKMILGIKTDQDEKANKVTLV